MNDYVDLVLKKEKKPASIDRIFTRVSKFAGSDFVLDDNSKKEIVDYLNKGVEDYKYYLTPNGNYVLMSKTSFRKGRFTGSKNGGSVHCVSSYTNKDGEHVVLNNNYSISGDDTNGAIDGDIVLVDIASSKVMKIIDRKLDSIIGEVYRIGSDYFVRPIDKRKSGIVVSIGHDGIEGEKVCVDLVDKTSDNFYIGEVSRVFGHKDDPHEDVLWEAFKYGIDDSFSRESWKQVDMIPRSVRDIDKIGREDFTDWEIFTIDGADTKDIDDAVSCRVLSNGNYELGVHIADVSHYVPRGSALDLDAYRKGTSNYLVGTVIPMLPHALSNGICSLNPGVDRLTMSVIMEINSNGEVVNSRITPGVIRSRLKMTYDCVNDILNNREVNPNYIDHVDSLKNLGSLSSILRDKRIEDGAIEFNRDELKVILDSDGVPIGFDKRVQGLGENLIEECMLIANETVDKFIVGNGVSCLHRVHDLPDPTRLDNYLNFLEAINYPFEEDCVGLDIANDRGLMQELVSHASSSKRLRSLLTLELIRCNSRAKYSPDNIGHYGLAKSNYCHFTSPIRRYPDLTIHRIIKDILNRRDKKVFNRWSEELYEIGDRCSRAERNADSCEDATLRMKCAEYMSNHIGDEYTGTVTNINDKGLKIELDNMIEGNVRIKDLKGDYVYSPLSYSLVSMDGFDDYYVGDRLSLIVSSASKNDKIINFKVKEKILENKISNSSEINKDVKIKEKVNRKNKVLYR